ncbi:MAG: hypothetical protein O7F73_01150 [Gammaproteobacteria bacterium]|nr:hypothetical protein [Gammaproteobacteria bacterium]
MSRVFWLATALILSSGQATANEQLDKSWEMFSQGLQQAQQSLSDPASFPPEPTDRNLSEGYRYMLGHLGRMIEMEMRLHPRYPEFFRSIDMLRKWTAENPDTMYLKAPIDSTGFYKVSGSIANTQEWRTSERGLAEPKAPRMVTFQTITDVPGATGELAEMANCMSQTLDYVNSFELEVDPAGAFEILVGPQRPSEHNGNFLLSKKRMTCPSTGAETTRHAQFLSVREIFSDWEHEKTIDMEIVRLDAQGESRPPMSAAYMSEKLEKMAKELPNQIRFWQLLQEVPLEIRSDVNGDGRRNMPVNGINQPAPPFTAGGVAGAQQLYAGGIFELGRDEAMIVKVTAPVEPHYVGFQLSNLWFEGPDQQNYVSSLTGHQLPVSSDGSRYYIVAHRDPGVAGWVDTTGLAKGSLSMRFIFRENPAAGNMPKANAQLVKLDDIHSVLPGDTPVVTPEQRKAEVAIRQSHIKMRWRGH